MRNIACILLQLLLRIRHVVRQQPVARYKSLDNNSPGQQNKSERQKRRAKTQAGRGKRREGVKRDLLEGKARQAGARRDAGLKVFPKWRLDGGAAAWPRPPVDSRGKGSHIRVELPTSLLLSSMISLSPSARLSGIRIRILFLFATACCHAPCCVSVSVCVYVSPSLCVGVCVCAT